MAKKTLLLAVAACAALGGPVLAADLVLTRAKATPLTEDSVGKPFWVLEAQCAGFYGAGYTYELANHKDKRAEADRNAGVAMLDGAVARLQTDRGLDRAGAMALAEPEVETGRGVAKIMLDRDGSGANSSWNVLRSACLDVAEAERSLARR